MGEPVNRLDSPLFGVADGGVVDDGVDRSTLIGLLIGLLIDLLGDVTVVADTGAVYRGDSAWLVCLWALDGYRGLALRLATPRLRPLARRMVATAAAVREGTTPARYGQTCDDTCARI